MWADTETEIDFLNYSEIAELIVELIANPRLLPLSLGVFGGWGVGKSSTLKLVEAELLRTPERYLVIKFDAWLYQDFDDARAALMSVIAAELLNASPPTFREKATSLFGRVNKLRALGLLVEGGAALFGVPTFGAASRGIAALGDMVAGNGSEEDVAAIKDSAKDAKEKSEGLLREAPTREPPQEIGAFRAELAAVLAGLGRTVVVFIDNLDRCLPANAIHTLEAIRLFLFMPQTAFVIAADEDMIRHAVAQHFQNPGERHVADYLDKLIQMPVRVPRAGVQEVRAYLFLLLTGTVITETAVLEPFRAYLIERLQLSWKEGNGFDVDGALKLLGREKDDALRLLLEMADRMAPMLAHATRVQGNPRIVKRLLNVVRMRASIARRRKMPLDEAMIAKLALFERCTDTGASEALHDAINAATAGVPDLLRELEGAQSEEAIRRLSPEAWHKHLPFLVEWARLDPKLAGIDLRPAVYLARETVPLRLSAATLSPKALRAVESLLRTATISSTAAAGAIASLEGGEHVLVMDQLVGEMRKNAVWDKVRPDFRGALLLARNSPEAAKIFGRFIRSLPKRPMWMNTLIKDDDWVEE